MSRIGRLPVAIPAGVTVEIAENNKVTVKGPKGTLERELPTEMEIKKEGEEIIVTRPNDLKRMKSLQTERSEENEISARSDKNTDQQHGCWCYRRISESSGSKRCRIQSGEIRKQADSESWILSSS